MENLKKILALITVLCISVIGKSQCAPTSPNLIINNYRNCDVTLSYEVSDCGMSYCNSQAQFGLNGLFVIAANSTFTVDVVV
jgi:hypothetical protein